MKSHLWNMFANIRNGQLAKRPFITHPRTKLCEIFLNILWSEGFILGYKTSIIEDKKLKIFLKYKNGASAINSLKIVSKPSNKVYYSVKQLWKLESENSLSILSTNKGLCSLVECKKQKIGGKLFLIVN